VDTVGADVSGRREAEELARLIERAAELKRDLVGFACSPQMKRSLAAAMAKADLEELEEDDVIDIIDRFALQYRMRDGRTVVDQFVKVGRIWTRRTGSCCSAGTTRWKGSSRSAARTAMRSPC
jgi:hypothetical protein